MIATLVAILLAADPSPKLPPTAFEVLRPQIHDVDTVRGDVALPWGVGLFNRSIRASGFDGWEVDKTRSKVEPFKSFTERQWKAETERGVKSRDELRRLADGGRIFVEWQPKNEYSAYGRIEGPLWVVTRDGSVVEVRQWAKKNGHERGASE